MRRHNHAAESAFLAVSLALLTTALPARAQAPEDVKAAFLHFATAQAFDLIYYVSPVTSACASRADP